MLIWDRYHNNNDDEWPIRPDGFFFSSAPPGEFCLLLNTDTGTDDKTLQLNTDTGTDTHCLELNTSTV